ncbi:MAG: head-tail connector protein [Holosporaceae bacterium]|jgi:hypothetical protein|nr:head-tail connector protein [Holosporaceae bacterium]
MHILSIEKPSFEIVSLQEIKNYLHIDHDFDDELLWALIATTREAMEAIVQKSIVKQTWSYIVRVGVLRSLCCDGLHHPCISSNMIGIPLPKPPVLKIVSVSVNDSKLGEEKYTLEKQQSRFCVFMERNDIFLKKDDADVAVVFEAGMAETSANIPYTLKLANLMMVANAYNERYSYKSDKFVTDAIRQLLNPFLTLRVS